MVRASDHGLTALRVEGGLLPPEFLLSVARGDAGHQEPADYGLTRSLALRDEIGRAFRIAVDLWTDFRGHPEPNTHGAVDRWLAPFLGQALGLRGLAPREIPLQLDGRRFPITHEAVGGAVPLVLVPPAFGLDRPDSRFGDETRKRRPIDLVQELLNASDERLFGIVSDGRMLRILRTNPNFTRPAWIELDLERTFEDRIFSDFAAFWMLAHGSRLEPREGGSPTSCILERWRQTAQQTGERARGELRKGVAQALLTFGQGFVRHPANDALRQGLADGRLSPEDLNRQLLRLVYRCVFLFVVEDRDLLHPPGTPDEARRLWREGYGIGHLRERSLRRRLHDHHDDLWQGLQIAFRALEQGVTEIGAPALGGLFRREQCLDLHGAAVDNASLLSAIRSLAFFRPAKAKSLARVNYRDMGTEELGSVYEGLLELHPRIEREPWAFAYVGLDGDATRGNERKLSGSYYTPDSLVQELVKSALEPVMLKAMTDQPYDRRAALLSLRILDPACGSGHFLLAAARRIAADVATIDAAPDSPTEAQRQHALREVAQRCIYGVDKNPLAVELCRAGLWIETVEPGRPLSFLDHRIREADSLIGVFDRRCLEDGIPDHAYRPRAGDDKAVARDLLKRNRQERAGQHTLALDVPPLDAALARLAGEAAHLEALPENDLAAVAGKAEAFRTLEDDPARRRLQDACDLWVGAFFVPLRKSAPGQPERIPTTDTARQALAGRIPQAVAPLLWELRQRHFLHWPLAFPEVFSHGGFDVVLGNPPWERIKLQEQEFFAARHEGIATAASKAARDRLIKALVTSDDQLDRELHESFQDAVNAAEAQSLFVRGSGRFSLTAVGDVNTYALFAELCLKLIGERGRAGIIVPTGIATDDSTKRFFQAIVDEQRLISLYDFQTGGGFFNAVGHARYKFSLITLSGSKNRAGTKFAFFSRNMEEFADRRRHFGLSPEDIALINPNTRTCPIFRTGRDADLTKVIYRHVSALIDNNKDDGGNPSRVRLRTMFHKTNASQAGHLKPASEVCNGANLARGWLPVHEGDFGHQFDHRFSTFDGRRVRAVNEVEHRDPYFQQEFELYALRSAYEEYVLRWNLRGAQSALLGFRRIARSTDERTSIATLLPMMPLTYGWIVILNPLATQQAILCGNLNSLVLDFCLRNVLSQPSIPQGVYEQLPVLPYSLYTEHDLSFIVPRVLELAYTAWDMQPFAKELGYDGEPFAWDPDRRAELRAELDAYFAWLYGLTRDELRYVLDPKEVMGDDFPSETFRS